MSEVEAYLPSTKIEGTYVCNYTKIEDWLTSVWHKNEVEIIQSQILDSKPIFLIRQ